jgi:hypothetical protein
VEPNSTIARFGSTPVLPTRSRAGLLQGVKQTKPGESGPLAPIFRYRGYSCRDREMSRTSARSQKEKSQSRFPYCDSIVWMLLLSMAKRQPQYVTQMPEARAAHCINTEQARLVHRTRTASAFRLGVRSCSHHLCSLVFSFYSGTASPEPPSSAGKSLSFGNPSFIGSTDSE